jgi:predicted Ser/Thr protein kinase
MPSPPTSTPVSSLLVDKVFRQGGGSRPEVSLVRWEGKLAVLKDFSKSDPWFRRLIGPLSVKREVWALRQLRGLAGVPALIAHTGKNSFILEYVDAKSGRELKAGDVPAVFFERMAALIDAMHARGVAHCDLRSTGNILMTKDAQPYFVDFAAHLKRGRAWNPLTTWLFRKFCEADRVAIARLKKTHAPELLTPEELAALSRDRKTFLERFARVLGKSMRNVGRFLLTRRSRR